MKKSGDLRRVVAFESRMAAQMRELLRKHGWEPVSAPSLEEIPLEENTAAFKFLEELLARRLDIAVFLTGVGTRYLAQVLETKVPRPRWIEALGHVEVVVRGPKPAAALREFQARIDVSVPEPNTWRELLACLVQRRELKGARIAVQEYGAPSEELREGLAEQGAKVLPVPVYRWGLPADTGPLRAAVRQIPAGDMEAALFTSAQQVLHALQVADEEGVGVGFRNSLRERVVVGSIGPTTSETLLEQGLPVDLEPVHSKMGHLVAALANQYESVRKRTGEPTQGLPAQPSHKEMAKSTEGETSSGVDLLRDSLFLRACRGEPTPVTPIWLMRQAGRYMAEYRALRSRFGFLDLCKKPELATEVTVTAAQRLGVDAAILFADILLILEPLGFSLEFAQGEGPVIHNPIRQASDVDGLKELSDAGPLSFVMEAVGMIRRALPADLPLIGFAGAPFTLACYSIEGGSSRMHEKAKAFMYADPGAWDALLSRFVDATAVYLNAQVEAGAQAVQIFDSWVGTLSPADYTRFVQPHMRRLFELLNPEVPQIHFGTDTAGLLELMWDAGGDVLGVDWRVDLAEAWDRVGKSAAIQGNLDPCVLLGPIDTIRREAKRILDSIAGRPGHIFNLGHGILPSTPVDHALALIDAVHEYRRD